MGSAKGVYLEKEIVRVLEKNENGLAFTDIYEELQKNKDYFKRAGSPNTLSDSLKNLQRKREVFHNIETRNYALTETGKVAARKYEIIDHIMSATSMDSFFNWATWKEKPEEISSIYMFIEAKNNAEPAVIRVPHTRAKHREPWEFDVLKVAEEMNLVKEDELVNMTKSKLTKIWNVLFKGTRRIVLVESLNPKLLLEELLLQLKKEMRESKNEKTLRKEGS